MFLSIYLYFQKHQQNSFSMSSVDIKQKLRFVARNKEHKEGKMWKDTFNTHFCLNLIYV